MTRKQDCLPIGQLPGHEHYVQGVAWDPLGEFVASESGDRTCRVFGCRNGLRMAEEKKSTVKVDSAILYSTIVRCGERLGRLNGIPVCFQAQVNEFTTMKVIKHLELADEDNAANNANAEDEGQKKLKHNLFFDDTLPSFFRRLAWSSDGSFLIAPAGTTLPLLILPSLIIIIPP